MSDLIPIAEVLALIGRKQIPNGFPRSVHRQRRGNPAMYDRAAVECWHAADERKKAEREQRRAKRERRRAAPPPEPTRAPCWPLDWSPDEDFPSRLRYSDKPGLDGIDAPAAVLAAETKRMSVERLKTRSRWQHLAVDPFAKPDPANIARSEAINARLPGRAKPEKTAAPPITLPERVTEPGFRSARAPRLQTVALFVGPRPKVARPSNPRFPAPPNGRPQRMAAPTTHAVSAGG